MGVALEERADELCDQIRGRALVWGILRPRPKQIYMAFAELQEERRHRGLKPWTHAIAVIAFETLVPPHER